MTAGEDGSDAGRAQLRRVLESLGSVYGDDEVDIDFGDELGVEERRTWEDGPSHEFVLPARVDEYLDADLSREREYELLLDTVNHLSYCRRVDSWDRTESFAAGTAHPEPVATFVHRMVEHAHVTAARLSEYRGLAGAYARRMEATFDEQPRVDGLREDAALLEGVRELAYTGRVAGLESASENVRGTLSYVGTELDRVREPGASAELRDEVANRVLETVVDRLYHPRTAERHLREELDLPFQHAATLAPETDAEPRETGSEESDEPTTASDIVELIGTVPLLPVVLAAPYLGFEDALESFYRPLPQGPFNLLFLLYPLLFPVFVVWGACRSVTGRLGYWEPIVDRASGAWNGITDATARLRGGLRGGIERVRSAVASSAGGAADAVNARLPGDRAVDLDSLLMGYTLLFVLPYELAEHVVGEDHVDPFLEPFADWGPSEGIAVVPYVLFVPPLVAALFPVFLVWLLVRLAALAAGVWEPLVARAAGLWDAAVATLRRFGNAVRAGLRRVPALIGSALRRTAELLRRWWNGLVYVARRGLARARGDHWKRDLPERLDEERLAAQTGDDTAAVAEPGRGETNGSDGKNGGRDEDDPGSGDGDAATESAPGDATTDGVETDEEDVVAEAGESNERRDDASVAAGDPAETAPAGAGDADFTERLLADAERRSASSRGEVSIVDVEYEESDGTVIDDALGDLASLDRRTSSELQGLRADRDDRIGGHGDPQEVLDAMSERGLDETIRELLAQFPPEERREVRAHTGHRLDLPAVARSAGGRLPNDGLFTRRRHTGTGSRCLGVAIDLSGSMDGFEAKVALASLASAADLLGDEFVAAGFHGRDRSVPLVTGPNEPFEPAHLSSVGTGGSTPLADGIREGRRLLRGANANERILLVVTDGAPNVGLSDSSDPKSDAREQIERSRRDGIGVIGVGVDSAYGMSELFGDDAYVEVNDRAFADRLLDVYRDQVLRTQRH
ncbi:hypothetical protein [Halosimplex halophilum]|uniref:hypothetical protein n=1 Tax=Halosimplex halophilum TaxID=2559572 RepID=UPI00107F2481|nr:hypothetical protein [Halosimplex halophilum]